MTNIEDTAAYQRGWRAGEAVLKHCKRLEEIGAEAMFEETLHNFKMAFVEACTEIKRGEGGIHELLSALRKSLCTKM